MKTYKQFSEEAEQLDEAKKWIGGVIASALGAGAIEALKAAGRLTGNVIKKGRNELKRGEGGEHVPQKGEEVSGLPRAS